MKLLLLLCLTVSLPSCQHGTPGMDTRRHYYCPLGF